MSDPHDTEPDVTVPIPLGLLRAGTTGVALRVYAELFVRARDGLIAVSARQLAGWMEWSSYGTAAHYLKLLTDVGALEVLYPGSFHPGAVTRDANVYRITAVDNRPRRDRRRADGAIGVAPSRRDSRRALSTPSGYQGDAAQTASDDPHRYPCYCDVCMDNLVALTDRDDP